MIESLLTLAGIILCFKEFILPSLSQSTLNTMFAVAIGIAVLIIVCFILTIVRGCRGRKKELSVLERAFDIIRANAPVLNERHPYIIIRSHYRVNSKPGLLFAPKYITMGITPSSRTGVVLGQKLGMEYVRDVVNGKDYQSLEFQSRSFMLLIERLIVLYRLYDRIEDKYQDDNIKFSLFHGWITAKITPSCNTRP